MDGRLLALGQGVRLLRFNSFAARFGKALLEAFHAAGRVDKLLLAGKERVAAGANFKANAGFGRARLERVSASANDRAFYVIGVNSCFHNGLNYNKLQEVAGANGCAVLVTDFEVKMGSRRDAGGADIPDELIKPDMLPFMNQNSR